MAEGRGHTNVNDTTLLIYVVNLSTNVEGVTLSIANVVYEWPDWPPTGSKKTLPWQTLFATLQL